MIIVTNILYNAPFEQHVNLRSGKISSFYLQKQSNWN